MKKILQTLVVLFAVFCTMPVWACSNKAGSMTGGACSISQLNNLGKNEKMQRKPNLLSKGERNLRPVKMVPEITNPDEVCYSFGMCLRQVILEK